MSFSAWSISTLNAVQEPWSQRTTNVAAERAERAMGSLGLPEMWIWNHLRNIIWLQPQGSLAKKVCRPNGVIDGVVI